MNVTQQRKLDDLLLECIKRTEKIIDRANMKTYMNYEQDKEVRAFDRTLQHIFREELEV